MKTRILINAVGVIFALAGSAAHANGRLGCDSTCLVPDTVTFHSSQQVFTQHSTSIVPLTTQEDVKYTYANCPVGFTYEGKTKYPTSQQVTITYFRNGQKVGTQTMPPQDLDEDCSKTEYQTVNCPAGQTGTMIQSRKVDTRNGGGYDYSQWKTSSNNCVATPVIEVRYTTTSFAISTGSNSDTTTPNDPAPPWFYWDGKVFGYGMGTYDQVYGDFLKFGPATITLCGKSVKAGVKYQGYIYTYGAKKERIWADEGQAYDYFEIVRCPA